MDRAARLWSLIGRRLRSSHDAACQPRRGIAHLRSHSRTRTSVKIIVGRLTASLRRHVHPLPRAVSDKAVARQILRDVHYFGVLRGRIEFEDIFALAGIEPFERLTVIF